jgi:hypothetical protein
MLLCFSLSCAILILALAGPHAMQPSAIAFLKGSL